MCRPEIRFPASVEVRLSMLEQEGKLHDDQAVAALRQEMLKQPGANRRTFDQILAERRAERERRLDF